VQSIWNNSYFIASGGGVTIEVLKKYIKQQDSPVESYTSLNSDCDR
jgi:putative transposase